MIDQAGHKCWPGMEYCMCHVQTGLYSSPAQALCKAGRLVCAQSSHHTAQIFSTQDNLCYCQILLQKNYQGLFYLAKVHLQVDYSFLEGRGAHIFHNEWARSNLRSSICCCLETYMTRQHYFFFHRINNTRTRTSLLQLLKTPLNIP